MSISISKENDHTEISMRDTVTIYEVSQYQQTLLESVCDSNITLCMAAVTDIDGAGIQLLVSLNKLAQDNSHSLTIKEISDTALERIKLYNLLESFCWQTNSEA